MEPLPKVMFYFNILKLTQIRLSLLQIGIQKNIISTHQELK